MVIIGSFWLLLKLRCTHNLWSVRVAVLQLRKLQTSKGDILIYFCTRPLAHNNSLPWITWTTLRFQQYGQRLFKISIWVRKQKCQVTQFLHGYLHTKKGFRNAIPSGWIMWQFVKGSLRVSSYYNLNVIWRIRVEWFKWFLCSSVERVIQ